MTQLALIALEVSVSKVYSRYLVDGGNAIRLHRVTAHPIPSHLMHDIVSSLIEKRP